MTPSGGGISGGRGRPSNGGSPETIDDRYEIKRLIGRGGQGDVFLAHDRNLDIDVAIKLLHPERREQFIQRFTHEARLIARLDSPNIVHIYDFNPRYPYIVMEYCGDGDLNQLIKSRRPLELPRIVALLKQICSALTTAHERNDPILHRDLKPGNVLFKKEVPKVADFGLAKVMSGDRSGLTTTRGMMGTFGYASPEQLKDASRVDHRTDLWALGVIAYELLTFRAPFESPGDDFVNIAIKVRTEDPAATPFTIPEPLWQFVQRSLEKEPDKRYASARDMAQALDQAVALIPNASRMSFPPNDALAEVDHIASKIAASFTSGSTDDARHLVREMRRISPEDSLVRYWEKRLTEASEEVVVSDSRPSPVTDTSDNQYRAIENLIAERDYSGARRECGKVLMANPGDARAEDLRERITNEEQAFSSRLVEVRRQAELARSSGDLHKVLEAWQRFEQQFPDYPDAKAELAFIKSELEAVARQEHRVRAERDAGQLFESGELEAALGVWDDYMREHPSDTEARALRDVIHRQLAEKRRQERRQALWHEGSQLHGEGRLAAALAVFETWLVEQPGDEQFVKVAETLRVEIADHEMAVLLVTTRREATALRQRADLEGAFRLWQDVLRDHPSQPDAKKEAGAIEADIEQRDKTALAGEVRELLDRLEARFTTGRYTSLDSVGSHVETALSVGNQNVDGGLPALRTARRELLDAGTAAEAALAGRLAATRAELRDHVAQAHELFESEDTDMAATDEEKALAEAWEAAVAELARPSGPDSPGDPVAGLTQAGARLAEAVTTLEAERSEAIRDAVTVAEHALRQSEAAVDALRAVPDHSGAAVDLGDLESRIQELRTQLGSRSVGRLSRVAGVADVVSSIADTNRIAALRQLHGQLRQVVEQAMEIAPVASGERLPTLLQAAASLLDPETGAAPAPAALVSTRDELLHEVANQRDLQGAAAARAQEHWAKLADTEAPPEYSDQFDEIKQAGAAALAALRFDDVERHATRLESLSRRGQIEGIWNAHRPAVRALEGPADEDGVVVGPADGESQDLLASYRDAVARFDIDRLHGLGERLDEVIEGAAASGDVDELPELGRRARKLNERFRADLLKRFDKDVADCNRAVAPKRHADSARLAAAIERSYAMLLQPRSVWRVAIPLVALVAIAGLAYAFWPGGGPAEVRLVSPEGATTVRSLTRSGEERTPPTHDITAAGVAWQLETGSYELTLATGVRLEFKVPEDRYVLVPGPPVDPAELMRELRLDDLGE